MQSNSDRFRYVSREEAIDRTMRYPYRVATHSYKFESGKVCRVFPKAVISELSGLTPVIAIGSNSAAEALDRKFIDFPDLYREPVFVFIGDMVGYAAVFSAQFSPYGAMPATIEKMSGSHLHIAVTYLSDRHLERMHETEDVGTYYSFVEIPGVFRTYDGLEILNPYGYVAMGGSFQPEGSSLSLDAIRQEVIAPPTSQREVQLAAMRVLGIEGSVEDFIAENASSVEIRHERMQTLSSKYSKHWL